jgi:hypothetical protein
MESNAAVIGSIAGREDEAEIIRRTAQAMRDLNSEQILGANKQRYYQQYDDLFNSIDQAAKSTFTDMSNGFSSVFKKAEDSLRSGLLAAIYELTAKPILISLKAQMLGASLTPEQAAQQQFYNSTGYRAELHYGERVQTAASVRNGDAASEKLVGLLQEVVIELRTVSTELQADKVQRGAVGEATIEKIDKLADKMDAQKRATRTKEAA